MDFLRLKLVFRKSIAKIRYYGFEYVIDIIKNKLHLSNEYSSMKKVESKYSNLSEKEYKEEMKKWFKANTGETLDFNNPITFNQKIQWLKIYDATHIKSLLVDKYRVREWVSKTIGEKYLINLIGAWECFDDIDFSTFPDRFVLKCNHGSHMNVIVDDIRLFDKEKAKKQFEQWLNTDFGQLKGFELQYKNVKPLIIAEEYIENINGEIYDYKFFCFSGKVEYIQFLSDRKNGLCAVYFDREWNIQKFTNNHPTVTFKVEKPDNLELMIELAEKLASEFCFVRVDLYRLNDGSIKFGEMTFSPASGTQDWRPASTNKMLGDLLILPNRK